MVPIALAFLAACVLAQQLPQLPGVGLAAAILALSMPLCLWRPLRLPAVFLAGFSLAVLQAHARLADRLPAVLDNADLDVVGVISSIPEQRGDVRRFEFDIETARQGAGPMLPWGDARVRLSWYRDAPVLRAGERWALRARLKRPWGMRNPGGFDYEAWLFQRGIAATGQVRGQALHQRLETEAAGYGLVRLRQALHDRIQSAVPVGSNQGLIAALTLGERSAIPNAQWDVYLATGVNHLLAISGTHISLMAGLGLVGATWLWRRSYRLCLLWAAPRAGAAVGLALGFGYALLAGFGVPVQRALVMLAVVLGALLAARQWRPAHSLAAALIAVLAYDASAVLSPGFWLSYAAVGFIFFGLAGRSSDMTRWRGWTRAQAAVSLGLLPAALLLFQRLSVVGPLANLVAIPAVGLLITPLALLGLGVHLLSPAAGNVLFGLSDGLLSALDVLLGWLSRLPYAQLQFSPPAWAFWPALPGTLLLLAPKGLPARWLGWVLLLPLFIAPHPRPAAGAFELTLLDVGQGLSAVVRTRQHTLVFDAGARFGENFDLGDSVVLPYLRSLGVQRLDLLVVSHDDNDHAGGAAAVRAGMPVAQVMGSQELFMDDARVSRCRAGETWNWDGVEFRILHPDPGWAGTENDLSCVVRVQGPGGTALLTGDIERPAELHLLRTARELLDTDALIVPHHGSRSSSGQGFVAAVSPRYALVPAGRLNRYGHPHAQTLATYAQHGSELLVSGETGALGLVFAPGAPPQIVLRYREQARRYWHGEP